MFRKWMSFSLGIIIIISITVAVFAFMPKEKLVLPEEFAKARINGAIVSEFINNFSNESLEKIKDIEKKDKEKRYSEALDLTIQELRRTKEARAKIIELLGELEKMASALPSIPNDEAQAIGMQAIATKISLIDKLLNYNEKTKSLLNILERRFASSSPQKFNKEMAEIINSMNESSLSINELNRKYQVLMEEFDNKFQ